MGVEGTGLVGVVCMTFWLLTLRYASRSRLRYALNRFP